MRVSRNKVALTLIVAAIAAATVSCGNASGKSRTLTVGLNNDIVALDPAFGYDNNTNGVINNITEGLLVYDKDNQVQPKLAKSVEAKADGLSYVYEIRNDVKFSDGSPLTVDDVLFSLERYRDPATASYVNWVFTNVKSIEKTGDWQVTITLKKPDALWKDALATTAGQIVSKKYYEEHKANFGKPDGGVLGSGPFVFKKWTTGSEIQLERNKGYWDKSRKFDIDKIVFKIIPEDVSRIAALKAGQIDVFISPPLNLLDQLREAKDIQLTYAESFYYYFVAFNAQRKPFDDPNVRKALYYAIDRKSIYDNIVKDAGVLANALPFGPGLWTFERDKFEAYAKASPAYDHDPAKAKELLAKTKVPKGFSFTLIYADDALRNALALSVQQSLKEIGVDVKLNKLTRAEAFGHQFGGKLKNGKRDYDVLLSGWVSDFPDPTGNITPLYGSANVGQGGSNAAGYSNPKLDKILEEQGAVQDPAKRFEILVKALDIINDEVPYANLFYPKAILASGKKYAFDF